MGTDCCQNGPSYPQQIPCGEDDLKRLEWYIDHKVPILVRDNRPNIEASGGTIYDMWMIEAESIIQTDLLKMAQPLRFDRIENISQLTRIKAIKTCEVLMRINTKEPGDVNDKRAEYFAGLYLAELSSLPLRLNAGAQVVPRFGIIRC